MTDYLKIIYSEINTPKTNYPDLLAKYLFSAYNMKKGQKILEPGCGRGEFLNGFKKMGLDVYGCDLSSFAGECIKDVEIKVNDVEKEPLPFNSNYFDIVYSKSFLEHLRFPEQFMSEAHRVLKPGGLMITIVPDWEVNYKIYFDDYTHRTPFSIISLKDIYMIFDFNKIQVKKFRQLPIVWKYPILNYFCAAISPFIPVRTEIKFLKWSRLLMLIGVGYKAN